MFVGAGLARKARVTRPRPPSQDPRDSRYNPSMRRPVRKLAVAALLAAGVLLLVFGPRWLEGRVNTPRIVDGPVPGAVRTLHDRLFVADLHADQLLWTRDLLERARTGAVDLPRLQEGNVGLQVFSIVTTAPVGPEFRRSGAAWFDALGPLALLQRWPAATWSSRFARALHQAARLDDAVRRANGALRPIRSATDLAALRRARDEAAARGATRPVGALLALEGLQAIEGDAANLDRLYDAGLRMVGFAHLHDNEATGSVHGRVQGGLTPLGRDVLRRAEARGMVVDLAHASPAAFDEVLALATKPVVVSHTGVRGTCDNPRNLADAQLRAVAANGGVVGIGAWQRAVCGTTPAHVARAVRHAANVAGIDHVALGSDWDGAVKTAVDAAHVALITAALQDAGFTDDEIRKVMGENAARVLAATLP